ncbi:putative oxidoreductase [Aeropyrum pernix K1]|uniref:Oxidoreductase n=1 Tax=Aeropyrum pernix (strain ATCC 700893 / DSM 11879 / JCM 9820 / NBRC 100138 / K1) TaxID=272557 RepID=Q9YFD2_AERPE|nr:FAD-dependent oxidoreductase [Aeropyrum pernix]BAA79264.2 putative oxidoreductase [Aeropyrum pernix K1]
MDRFDTVVVGAGVVGLFTAIQLAWRGYSVAVVEELDRVMGGVSSRSANVIHVLQTPFSSLKSRLCVEGNRLHFVLSRELGYSIVEAPLILAYSEEYKAPLAATVSRLLPRLVPKPSADDAGPEIRFEHLRGPRLRDLEPGLSDRVKGGVVVYGYGVVDYRSLASSLERRVKRLGELFLSSPLRRVEERGGYILLHAGEATLAAKAVVNAAGLMSHVVARLFADKVPSQTPLKGVMSIHRGPRLRSIVAPLELRRGETKGGGAIPQSDGSLLLGPNNAGPTKLGDESYTKEDLDGLRSRFQPLLAEPVGEPYRVVVGLRPVAPGRDFKVARGKGSVVHMVGIESPGLTAAPSLAAVAASMIDSILRSK